jgi:hypothetical protein
MVRGQDLSGRIVAGPAPALSSLQTCREVLMKYQRWFAIFLAALILPLCTRADTGPSTGSMSLLHVRIVRLSFVQGQVAIRRAGETDWSAGAVNTPVQEGFSVATGANSFAEVEFENGSTARLGQDSEIHFTELALTQQGDRVNKLELSKGYATFHFVPEHHDKYEVDASGVTFTTHGKAEFRTNFTGDSLRVEVFEGQLEAAHDGKTEEVGKNRILTYDPNAAVAFNTSNGIQKDEWDKWTQARDEQAVLATNDESLSLNNPLFGWSDLDTYGAWNFFPGYGYGWAPYEPAGWSPYSAGMWGYYPSWGFTWISAEPWGWLPYHNGFWNYDASMGWFWMPGPLDAWSPALVNWYDGPGWVGWEPLGSGAGACAISTPGCLTAVAPGTIEQGTPLRPGSPLIVHPVGVTRGSLTRIEPPQLQRSGARSVTMLGPPIAAMRGTARGPVSPSMMHVAPSSVVMGRQVNPDTFVGHHGFFSGPQAIHAQLGRTMGGVVPTVVARDGEVSIDSRYRGPQPTAMAGARAGASARGPEEGRVPVMMSHASAGGPSASIDERGGIRPASSASAPSEIGGPASSGNTAAAASAPIASAPMSSGSPSGAARSGGAVGATGAGGRR